MIPEFFNVLTNLPNGFTSKALLFSTSMHISDLRVTSSAHSPLLTPNRPAILLLNNIFVRQNENKHRFIIMTQNFSPRLLSSCSGFRALSEYHHLLLASLIAPYIWLCVAVFSFSIFSYSLLFLLLRSPEQYTRNISPLLFILHLTYDSLKNIVSYGFSLHHHTKFCLPFLGFFWAFLTRKIIVTFSPSFVLCSLPSFRGLSARKRHRALRLWG